MENYNILFSGISSPEDMKNLPSLPLFDDEICSYLNELSSLIMKDGESKSYPDVVTFGFFCRKGNMKALKERFYSPYRLGRGLSFHVAPSNVPINLAYTLLSGLLSGNSCIVRASSKNFRQTEILCRLMKKINSPISKYIMIVIYPHSKEITDYFSSLADVRILWGGDTTIKEIRKSQIPARCVELSFADRYSLLLIKAEHLLKMEEGELKRMAEGFYNDTYLYDQNACSSPRLIYWVGNKEEIKKAQNIFWQYVYNYTLPKYNIEPIIAVNKLLADYRAAIDFEGVNLLSSPDNLIKRIRVKELDKGLISYTSAGGSFIEYESETLRELFSFVTKKFQTLSYAGFNSEEMRDMVIKSGVQGIDRIVPIGKTSDFSFIWDGYNLINEMSRYIYNE